MGSLTIRPATHDDITAIKEIGERTWPATYGFAEQDYVTHGLATWWSSEAIGSSLEHTVTLVAEHDGSVIGMGNIDPRQQPPVIWKLYVLPAHQGTGAGHALIEALVSGAGPEHDAVSLE